jgi:hypothetical protein
MTQTWQPPAQVVSAQTSPDRWALLLHQASREGEGLQRSPSRSAAIGVFSSGSGVHSPSAST